MTFSTIVLYTTLLSFIFATQTNPALLLIILLTLALMVSISLFAYSTWMAVILYLVYVGGLLVMFSYFITMNSNKMLQLPPAAYMMTLIPLYTTNYVSNSVFEQSSKSPDNPLTELYFNAAMLIFLGLILLVILLVVAKIANRGGGSLRPHK